MYYIPLETLPRSCLSCPVVELQHSWNNIHCPILEQDMGQIEDYRYSGERPDDCPIKESEVKE